MPSIRDLFGVEIPASGDEVEGDFDLQKFLDEADGIIGQKNANLLGIANQAIDPNAEPIAAPAEPNDVLRETIDGETPPVEPTEPEIEPPAPESVEPPLAPIAVADPLSELPPERRAAMLAIDQVLASDPQKRDAIFSLINGQQPVAARVPEPELPDDIMPGSVEARLWEQQVTTQRQIAELREAQQRQTIQTEQQRATNDAMSAAQAFGARHPQLSEADVMEIAQFAGKSGVAGAFAQAHKGNERYGLEQAFESVLYSNELFRAKVIETPVQVEPGEQPQAVDRKRKLTALSSAASPVATSPTRSQPLESRPDGRLTPESRTRAVQEVATQLLRANRGY